MQSLPEWQREFAASLPGPYRINVFANWEQALTGAYPIVRKIVGEEFFAGMAREYAQAFPSRSGDLNEYGDSLPRFVAGYTHTQDLPYLADVARMEWLAHRAHYAADGAPLDTAAFARGNPETIRLCLSPSCALMASPWPIARIWEVHQPDFAGKLSVNLAAGPQRILIHRPGWRVDVVALEFGDYGFLASAVDGATLGEALETAAASDPAFDATGCLARWAGALR